MPNVGPAYPGAYRAGGSYLHQLDPRLKLLLLCLLMACLFSATTGWRLLVLFGLWLFSARCCQDGWQDGWRMARLLRWLLLFTLLLHLFFTPGRTLFGTSWLSADGLLRGLLVDTQLLLAVLFSLLLAWTTKPQDLTWGLTSLLSPLQRIGVPVREAGGLLILVLQFFPIIRDETAQLKGESGFPKGLAGLRARAVLVSPLLLRLIDRADQLAAQIVSEGEAGAPVRDAVDRRLTHFDWFFFVAGFILLALIWMV